MTHSIAEMGAMRGVETMAAESRAQTMALERIAELIDGYATRGDRYKFHPLLSQDEDDPIVRVAVALERIAEVVEQFRPPKVVVDRGPAEEGSGA